jgi:hypothetical protein
MEGEFLPNLLSGALSVLALCVFVAGVMKVFQIAGTLNEIRDALKDIQRQQDAATAASRPLSPAHAGQTGEEMLRALDAQMRLEESAPVHPEIIRPR